MSQHRAPSPAPIGTENQQHPNTVGTTSTARFSDASTNNRSSMMAGMSVSSGNTPNIDSRGNRHVSLAAGVGGGLGNVSSGSSGNVGSRLATARAVSPRLPPGSAGPGGGFSSSNTQQHASQLLSSATNLGLGPAPGAGGRGQTGIRPASEYLGMGGAGNKAGRGKEATPENEAIDNWFTDLQAYEAQLDALASASLDQNFTDELQAIESWFRVLSENERTAALYSLLQQSTTAQVRFFQKVLSQMSQADPVAALLSPALGGSFQNQQTPNLGGLKSPGLQSGFPASPHGNQFLTPDLAAAGAGAASVTSANAGEPFGSPSAQLSAQRNRLKQNRISAPGTLQVSDAGRFLGGQLNDVMERSGASPSGEDDASTGGRSPAVGSGASDSRPKSTDFAGIANAHPDSRSPRPGYTSQNNLGLPSTGLKSPRFDEQFSPALQGNWASLMSTPMMPGFNAQVDQVPGQPTQAELAAAMNGLNTTGSHGNHVVLDDAAKFKRRPQNAMVFNDDGEPIRQNQGQQWNQYSSSSPRPGAGGFPASSDWRSPALGSSEFGSPHLSNLAGLGLGSGGVAGAGALGSLDPAALSGLGMGMGLGGIGMGMPTTLGNPNPMFNSTGFAGAGAAQGLWSLGASGAAGGQNRSRSQTERSGAGAARKSPMLRQGEKTQAGGGAGAGAGVAGEDDVDERVLKDVAYWLRVLRLHKYTSNFQGEKWQDIVTMKDAQLQDKGVAALGARRKLLKVFANVRSHYKIPHPEGYLEELGTDEKEKEKDGKEGKDEGHDESQLQEGEDDKNNSG